MIYLDFDDTIVNTTKLFKKYFPDVNLSVPQSDRIQKEVTDFFCSQKFFDEVEFNEGAVQFINLFKDEITVCSVGEIENLRIKELFLNKHFPNIQCKLIPFNEHEQFHSIDKYSYVEFTDNDIVIDDNKRFLNLITNDNVTKIHFIGSFITITIKRE